MMAYLLKYMSLRARGEPVRWVLKVIGVDYSEETFDIFKEWPTRKHGKPSNPQTAKGKCAEEIYHEKMYSEF